MGERIRKRSFFSFPNIAEILGLAFKRLSPGRLRRNPLLLFMEIGCIFLTLAAISDATHGAANIMFNLDITIWSWLTLYFIGLAQVLSERSGMLQAEGLLYRRKAAKAKLVRDTETTDYILVDARKLNRGDIIYIEAGDVIPIDGEIIDGIASVDESAITGESALVLRESGGSRSAVTGGTRVVSDHIYVEVTGAIGTTFVDQMLGMVDDRARKRTSSEICLFTASFGLGALLFTIVAVVFIITHYSGARFPISYIIVAFISLLPITFAGLLPTVAAAEMNRLVGFNVIAKSTHMIENSGEISLMLLDKTGTITLGNRIAYEFIPLMGISIAELAEYALIASHGDETAEGKSITALAQTKYSIKEHIFNDVEIIPFSAQTRISGINYRGKQIRKGAPDTIGHIAGMVKSDPSSRDLYGIIEKIASTGGTPMLVMVDKRILGVIHLKDVIKAGMKERFQRLRQMGIKTIMLTGDNPLTAAAIAAEAGVDDYVAEATPETKMSLIEKEQRAGRLVAMCGDGTNDAPALAKADIGLVMSTGTQAARDAGNMLDLDSDPTKLIEIISVGRQLLITRGALFIFTISTILAKYVILFPLLFAQLYPEYGAMNFLALKDAESVILSMSILNAFLILLLTPFILQGAVVRNIPVGKLSIDNLILYGMGGIVVTITAVKAIDVLIKILGG